MAFCGKCGTNVEGGLKFCPNCGNPMGAPVQNQPVQNQQPTQQNDFGAKIGNFNNTVDSTDQFDPQDIQNNKTMAILAYLGILVLVPLFAAKESRFARYHTNQGLILAIVEVAYGIIYSILSGIILAISWRLYFLVSIIGLVSIVFLVAIVIGIINAANGRAKELPVIGKFKLLK